jgi:hypothetical protein
MSTSATSTWFTCCPPCPASDPSYSFYYFTISRIVLSLLCRFGQQSLSEAC